MEAAVRFKKPLIGDSFVCGDAAALSHIGGKPQCGVLAGRSAAVGAGEGMSAVVDSGQDAHLLPGQATLHRLDDRSKADITPAIVAFAAGIHICLVQLNLAGEDFTVQNPLQSAHQAMAHVEGGLDVHSNPLACAPEALSAEGVQNQRLPLVGVLVGIPCQAATVICEPPST